MIEALKNLVMSVAIGCSILFAAFFIFAGLYKREIWGKIYEHINFK